MQNQHKRNINHQEFFQLKGFFNIFLTCMGVFFPLDSLKLVARCEPRESQSATERGLRGVSAACESPGPGHCSDQQTRARECKWKLTGKCLSQTLVYMGIFFVCLSTFFPSCDMILRFLWIFTGPHAAHFFIVLQFLRIDIVWFDNKCIYANNLASRRLNFILALSWAVNSGC